MADISDLIGKAIVAIQGGVGDDRIRFQCLDGTAYRMIYHQDCCACCDIHDIIGDINDLIGAVVLDARAEHRDASESADASATWTFYIIQSNRGAVTIRWYGSSNGYYSETATFEECP